MLDESKKVAVCTRLLSNLRNSGSVDGVDGP